MYEIGERIKRLRVKKSVTQKAAGSVLGVSQNTISQKERGLSSFSPEEIQLLCRLWQTDIRYAFGYLPLETASTGQPTGDLKELLEIAQSLPPAKLAEIVAFVQFQASADDTGFYQP